jgi:hypothetical protein
MYIWLRKNKGLAQGRPDFNGFDRSMSIDTAKEQAQEDIAELFGQNPLAAFDRGRGIHLMLTRNRRLGSLLAAERNVFYIQILYRMLLFKREHELEPLYEDIYQGVRLAQESFDAKEYSPQQFRIDMAQLADWELVTFRIERERLRGYRDNRKRKFRYALTAECGHLIQWLESRLMDDLEDRSHDTRDLLQDVCGALNELLRLLHCFKKDDETQTEQARRIIFQLFKTDDLTRAITEGLVEFNSRLLHFVIQQYDVAEVKQIISELDTYVHAFLNQVFALRREILPLINRLLLEKNQQKIDLCFLIMEQERLQAPHIMQGAAGTYRQGVAERLRRFYIEDGKLDMLHQRIGASVIQVWQKLRSHLRELERKNNRLADLQSRISEIARLPDQAVPDQFMTALLSPANMYGDMHYWDTFQKADPPEPRRRIAQKETPARTYLRSKTASDKPIQTMNEARLQELEHWLQAKIIPAGTKSSLLSGGNVDEHSDFVKIMELAQAGFLNEGRRLARINYTLSDRKEVVRLAADGQALELRDMTVERKMHEKK